MGSTGVGEEEHSRTTAGIKFWSQQGGARHEDGLRDPEKLAAAVMETPNFLLGRALS